MLQPYLLFIFLTPLLLPACNNVNRFVASYLVPLLFFFILSILYRVDDAETLLLFNVEFRISLSFCRPVSAVVDDLARGFDSPAGQNEHSVGTVTIFLQKLC